ncbi:MAG: NUDIX domain-containing protein [Candidatus Parcubacteria bacterium]|nr:NUDIX domain-containing protein [Candidatus Parcubacteria bacterium]
MKFQNEIWVHLERRSKSAERLPDFFGMWGGGTKVGETHEQALVREVQEEMSFKPVGYKYVGPYQVGESIKHIYILEVASDFDKHIVLTEAQFGKFFNLEMIEAEKELREDDKVILRDVINKLK